MTDEQREELEWIFDTTKEPCRSCEQSRLISKVQFKAQFRPIPKAEIEEIFELVPKAYSEWWQSLPIYKKIWYRLLQIYENQKLPLDSRR